MKKHVYSKVIVASIIVAIVSFWILETILIYSIGNGYPNYFVYAWFTFWSVELVSLAGIKVNERKNNPYNKKDDDDDLVG